MGSENENIFRHIRNAVVYSWAGLKTAWHTEMSFRTQTIVIAVMMPIGIWIGDTAVELSLLILMVELLNSAVENVVDRIGAEHHILSQQAKDLGSAAAAISMLTAVIVWGLIAYERFMN